MIKQCGDCKWRSRNYLREEAMNHGICLETSVPADILMDETEGQDCPVFEERKE